MSFFSLKRINAIYFWIHLHQANLLQHSLYVDVWQHLDLLALNHSRTSEQILSKGMCKRILENSVSVFASSTASYMLLSSLVKTFSDSA